MDNADAPQLLSKAEYAKHRGVSKAMVSKWAKAKRLVIRNGKVDVAKSDERIGKLAGAVGGKGDSVSRARRAAQVKAGAREAAGGGASSDGAVDAVLNATAEKAQVSTDILKAKLGRETGRLVDREAFERGALAAAAMTQRGLMTLPARLVAVAAEQCGADVRKLFPVLEDECAALANELAGAVDTLADQVESTQH